MTEIRPGTASAGVPAAEHRRLSPEVDARHGEHLVPKAKFPVDRLHGHRRRSQSPESIASVVARSIR